MSPLTKYLIAGVSVLALCMGAFVFSVERYHRSGPPAQERRAREIAVQPLLQSHATREEVVQALGLELVDYSVGSTNRQWLERAVYQTRVREGVERYPGVLFHTTPMTMTWLFFDADGRLQDYYLCEQ